MVRNLCGGGKKKIPMRSRHIYTYIYIYMYIHTYFSLAAVMQAATLLSSPFLSAAAHQTLFLFRWLPRRPVSAVGLHVQWTGSFCKNNAPALHSKIGGGSRLARKFSYIQIHSWGHIYIYIYIYIYQSIFHKRLVCKGSVYCY